MLIVGVFSSAIAAENYAGIGVALYKSSRGATVAAIANGSPASAADLRLGDCVIAVNGADIAKKTVSEVKHMIRDDAGKPLTLTIVRDGNTLNVELTRIKMQVVSLKDKGDAKQVASNNYALLDVVNVKDEKTGFYVEKSAVSPEKRSPVIEPFGDVRLNRFTRKNVDVNVLLPGHFTIKILTADGSLVSQKDVNAENIGLKSIHWDNTLLAAGSYTIVLKQGSRLSSYQKKLR